MRDLWYLVLNKILLVWSFSPVMAILSIDNFLNIEFKCKDGMYTTQKDITVSMINIRLGGLAIQLFSRSDYQEEVIDIRLVDIEKLVREEYNEDAFGEREKGYRQHTNVLSDADLVCEKEAIEERIKQYEECIKKISEKIKSLHSVVLAIIPVAFAYMSKICGNNESLLLDYVVMGMDVYLLGNMVLILFKFYSEGMRRYSSFRDIRKCINKKQEIVIQKYMNLQYVQPIHSLYAAFFSIYKNIIDVIILINMFYVAIKLYVLI